MSSATRTSSATTSCSMHSTKARLPACETSALRLPRPVTTLTRRTLLALNSSDLLLIAELPICSFLCLSFLHLWFGATSLLFLLSSLLFFLYFSLSSRSAVLFVDSRHSFASPFSPPCLSTARAHMHVRLWSPQFGVLIFHQLLVRSDSSNHHTLNKPFNQQLA